MTGIDVVETTLKILAQIAVVVVSADPPSELAGLGDCYAHLRKPVDQRELLQRIETSCKGLKVKGLSVMPRNSARVYTSISALAAWGNRRWRATGRGRRTS